MRKDSIFLPPDISSISVPTIELRSYARADCTLVSHCARCVHPWFLRAPFLHLRPVFLESRSGPASQHASRTMSALSTPRSDMSPLEGLKFKPMSTPCERADSYRPGGFHPIHFQDVLHRRYRVIRKLGYGSFATVWLAVDSV